MDGNVPTDFAGIAPVTVMQLVGRRVLGLRQVQ